jgi:hypothetical protein
MCKILISTGTPSMSMLTVAWRPGRKLKRLRLVADIAWFLLALAGGQLPVV